MLTAVAGIHLKKATVTFPDLDAFVEYYSVPRDGLPCPLKVTDAKGRLISTVSKFNTIQYA